MRTDLRQSTLDYRFLANVMGSYPICPSAVRVYFENKMPYFVVFESKSRVVSAYWAAQSSSLTCQSHARFFWTNM